MQSSVLQSALSTKITTKINQKIFESYFVGFENIDASISQPKKGLHREITVRQSR